MAPCTQHQSHPKGNTWTKSKLLYIMKASSPFHCINPINKPLKHHTPTLFLDGKCVEGFSILVSEETRYEMRIMQTPHNREFVRAPIPYMYKMTIMLQPGLNHICWCTECTAVSVLSRRHPGNSLLLLPKFGFGTMTTYQLEETETPYYTDEEGPKSTYRKIDPPLVDPVRPKVYPFQPNTPPKYLTVISPPGKVPALWVWAKIGAGGHGFQETKRAAVNIELPAHLHKEHVRIIRHRRTIHFGEHLATYEGCLDNFEHRPRRTLNSPAIDPVNRPLSRPPNCGHLPEDRARDDYAEPITDESEPEDGPLVLPPPGQRMPPYRDFFNRGPSWEYGSPYSSSDGEI